MLTTYEVWINDKASKLYVGNKQICAKTTQEAVNVARELIPDYLYVSVVFVVTPVTDWE